MSNIFYSNVDANLQRELNSRGRSGKFDRSNQSLNFMLGKIATARLTAFTGNSSRTPVAEKYGVLGGETVRDGRFLPNGPNGFLTPQTYTTSSIVFDSAGAAKLETSPFIDDSRRVGPFVSNVDVNIGDHWDLWIARGVKKEDEMKVIEYLKHKIILNLQLNDNNLIEYKDILLSQYIDIIYQGEEHVLFRRALKIFTNYEPKNKTLSRSINNEITTARKNHKNRYNNYFNNNDGNIKIDYDDNDNSKIDYGDDNDNDNNNVTFSMIGNDESNITEKKDNKNNLKNNVSSNNSINNNSNDIINSDDILTDDKVDFWRFKPMTDDTNNNNLSTTNSTALNNRSDNVEIPYLPIIKYEATTNSVGVDEAYITSNMFDINESFTITPLDRKKIIDTAVIDPSSLIGYQV